MGGGLPDGPAWAPGGLWDCPGRGHSRDTPLTTTASSISPGHSGHPGHTGGERAQGLGETGGSPHRTELGPGGLLPGPQPVPGGLVTWWQGTGSLQAVKLPGVVSCLGLWHWEPRGISNPEGRSQLCPNPVARNPETKLEVGAAVPGEEGEWTQREEGRGPGEGGTDGQGGLRHGLSSWQGPTPWSISSPTRARESDGPTSRVSALDPIRRAVWTTPRGSCGTLPKREAVLLLLLARWRVFLRL